MHKFSYLCVETIVTKIKRGIDGLEGLKVDGHFLFFVVVRQNRADINHEPIIRNLRSRTISDRKNQNNIGILLSTKHYLSDECMKWNKPYCKASGAELLM